MYKIFIATLTAAILTLIVSNTYATKYDVRHIKAVQTHNKVVYRTYDCKPYKPYEVYKIYKVYNVYKALKVLKPHKPAYLIKLYKFLNDKQHKNVWKYEYCYKHSTKHIKNTEKKLYNK
jgi:hypothetical protein